MRSERGLVESSRPSNSVFELHSLEERIENSDEADRIPDIIAIRTFDIICFIVSIFTYLFDVGSDLLMAYVHYINGRIFGCIMTLAFTVLASFALNAISLAWWISDFRKSKDVEVQNRFCKLICGLLVHMLQFGPIFWLVEALKFAIMFQFSTDGSEKREIFKRMCEADRDASLLRLFEAFFESIPQMIVQGVFLAEYFLAIIVNETMEKKISFSVCVQMISTLSSLLSACWAMNVQHRSLRLVRHDKEKMNINECALQLTWRFFTMFSRCSCLVLFIAVLQYWIIPIIIIHYLISLIHVYILQFPHIDIKSKCARYCLVITCAVVHIFAPLNVAEGVTKWRYATAYTVEAVENLILISSVCITAKLNDPAEQFIFHVLVVSFFLGIIAMLIYYRRFHPTRRYHENISFE